MVKHGPSSFSARSVVRSGVVLSLAVEKAFSLEEEVCHLCHHVSVLPRACIFARKSKMFCARPLRLALTPTPHFPERIVCCHLLRVSRWLVVWLWCAPPLQRLRLVMWRWCTSPLSGLRLISLLRLRWRRAGPVT